MVKSMTGYGRARETRNKRDITVEVRSVNNRYLDCTVKLPRAYVFAEDAIKGRVQKAVSRGKVDVFVTIDSSAADVSVVKVNEPLARSYYEALLRLKETFGLSGEVTPVELSRCPDVLSVTKAEEDLETLAEDICQVTDAALAGSWERISPPEPIPSRTPWPVWRRSLPRRCRPTGSGWRARCGRCWLPPPSTRPVS